MSVLRAYPGLVVSGAFDGASALLEADVVVWDTPEAIEHASVPTLVLVSAAPEARAALRSGAHGALLRASPAAAIAPAAVAVASGHWVLDGSFAHSLLDLGTAPAGPTPTLPLLSPREQQVLELLSEGLSNRDVASRLGISRHTAKFHVNAILDKLGATTRTEAVVLAARSGLLTL